MKIGQNVPERKEPPAASHKLAGDHFGKFDAGLDIESDFSVMPGIENRLGPPESLMMEYSVQQVRPAAAKIKVSIPAWRAHRKRKK
ncbi:MAG: hypothetical protein K6T61_06605 [Bryobacteraceae bacterium]|nr:hypothetical protein [Bryobacteraceae bacterium]